MVIDGEDFYLDLLFFHRRLRRLVAIELKFGRFKAGHKGQMELYLAWLNQHERQAGEETPKEELQRQLHQALHQARERLARRGVLDDGANGNGSDG